MKKRYIYGAVLSATLFILLYIIFNFPPLIAIILAVVTYIGGILLFKEKDVRKYDAGITMHHCYLVSKINNYTNLIKDEKVNKNIKDISVKAEKIIQMLQQKPDKVTQIYDGFDYYLPFTIRILEQYWNLESKDKITEEEKKFRDEINDTLDVIENEIDKLLENMNYTKMIDINASIEVFKKQASKLEKKIDGKESEDNA